MDFGGKEKDVALSQGGTSSKRGFWAWSSNYALCAGVYGVTCFIFFSRAGYEISVGLLAYAVVVKLLRGEVPLPGGAVHLLMAGYLLSTVLSVAFASNPHYALSFLWKKLPYMAVLYLSGWMFLSAEGKVFNQRVRVLLLLMLAVVSVVGVDGVYQFFTGWDFIKHNATYGPRLTSIFGNPNEFHYMVPFMVGGALAVKAYSARVYRWAAGAGLAALVFTVINSQSRALWLCTLGLVFFYVIYKMSYKTAVIAMVVLLGAVYATHVVSDTRAGGTRFTETLRMEKTADSLSDRLDMWKLSWAKFLERPVLGHGPGLFNREFNTLEAQGRYGVKKVLFHSHNIYLQTLAEKGALGAFFFLALFFWLFRDAFRRVKYAPSAEYGLALLFVLGSLAAFYMSGMADMDIDNWRFNSLWVLIFSFGAALTNRPFCRAATVETGFSL